MTSMYGISIVFKSKDIIGQNTPGLDHFGISIMQQRDRVLSTFRVWGNIQLAAQPNNNAQLQEIIPLLQLLRHELQHLMVDKLSGGQKHQLSLAMTLATHPRLVIFDEPSAGSSPIAVEEMYTIFRAIRERLGVSIILIEQNVTKTVEFSNHCVTLEQGAIKRIVPHHINTNECLPKQ